MTPGAVFPQKELSARLDREELSRLVADEKAKGSLGRYHAGRLLNVARPHAGATPCRASLSMRAMLGMAFNHAPAWGLQYGTMRPAIFGIDDPEMLEEKVH